MNIPFSAKTNDLIFELKEFTDKDLSNVSDFGTLTEITYGKGEDESFQTLIFNGKYVNGLKRVIDKDVSISDEAKQNIYQQFQSAIEMLVRNIKDILENHDPELQSYFETKYLMLTQENLANLLDLSGDLAIAKEYYNTLK